MRFLLSGRLLRIFITDQSACYKRLRCPELVQHSNVLGGDRLVRLLLLLMRVISLLLSEMMMMTLLPLLLLALTKNSLHLLSSRETLGNMTQQAASILVAATATRTGESAVICYGLPIQPRSRPRPTACGSCKHHHRPTITSDISFSLCAQSTSCVQIFRPLLLLLSFSVLRTTRASLSLSLPYFRNLFSPHGVRTLRLIINYRKLTVLKAQTQETSDFRATSSINPIIPRLK